MFLKKIAKLNEQQIHDKVTASSIHFILNAGGLSMDAPQEHALPDEITIPKTKLTFGDHCGDGNFGDVYQGIWHHTALHTTTVAIKQLKMKHMPTRIMEDFVKEVIVHAKLNHDKVVKLYGVTVEQPYCMVMEYMANGTLRQYLDNTKPTSVQWSIRFGFAHNIADGLAYLHAQTPAIIHGDLKSLNILLDEHYQAKIGDFGLAKIKSETASQYYATTKASGGGPKGSLLWMAPELFEQGGKNKTSQKGHG